MSSVVLVGHRIGYSASPAMHNAAFAALGRADRYELADVEAGRLPQLMNELRGADRLGANVTQPHKVAVCDLVDELAPEVLHLGAANTIVRHGGRLRAHNTDLAALTDVLADRGAIRHAVVLGTGGASRAVVAALHGRDTDVAVIGRADWHTIPAALATAHLLVNATPIGTGTDASPVEARLLRPDLAVLDLVYRPSPTRLVREACEAGAWARGGAGMLLAQAAASFELWTGLAAPIEVMRDALRAELGPDADV